MALGPLDHRDLSASLGLEGLKADPGPPEDLVSLGPQGPLETKVCQELLVRGDLQEPSEEQATRDHEDHWASQDPPENRALTVAPETTVFPVVLD